MRHVNSEYVNFFLFFFSVVQTVWSFSIRMPEKGSLLTVFGRRIENVWVKPMNNRKVFFVFLLFSESILNQTQVFTSNPQFFTFSTKHLVVSKLISIFAPVLPIIKY